MVSEATDPRESRASAPSRRQKETRSAMFTSSAPSAPRPSRFRRASVAALAVTLGAFLVLAAGCSGGSSASTSASQPNAAAQTQQLPNAAAQSSGNSAPSASGAPSSMAEVQAQNAATTLDSATSGKGPIVLFDVAHMEIFGPKNTSQLGQSAAVARMRKAGVRVVATHDPYTPAMLKDASAVVISGNMQPLSASELQALDQFMNKGGIVLVAVHVAPMDLNIAQLYGLSLSQTVLVTTNPGPGDDPKNLTCTGIEKSALTEGVSSVRVLGAWAVGFQAPATVAVGTGSDAWLDEDGNGQITSADRQGPFGMIVERRVGKGELILSGDDAVFANLALASTDNVRLLDNIIAVMKNAK